MHSSNVPSLILFFTKFRSIPCECTSDDAPQTADPYGSVTSAHALMKWWEKSYYGFRFDIITILNSSLSWRSCLMAITNAKNRLKWVRRVMKLHCGLYDNLMIFSKDIVIYGDYNTKILMKFSRTTIKIEKSFSNFILIAFYCSLLLLVFFKIWGSSKQCFYHHYAKIHVRVVRNVWGSMMSAFKPQIAFLMTLTCLLLHQIMIIISGYVIQ